MRETRIIGDLGEYFTAMCLINDQQRFTVDLIDSKGIDLMAYSSNEDGENTSYGISVKSRNVAVTPNSSILLRDKDIDFCYEESMKRGSIPCFSFVVVDQDRIDMLIITFDWLLEWRNATNDFDRNTGHFHRTNLSVNIGMNARNQWGHTENVVLWKSFDSTGSHVLK